MMTRIMASQKVSWWCAAMLGTLVLLGCSSDDGGGGDGDGDAQEAEEVFADDACGQAERRIDDRVRACRPDAREEKASPQYECSEARAGKGTCEANCYENAPCEAFDRDSKEPRDKWLECMVACRDEFEE